MTNEEARIRFDAMLDDKGIVEIAGWAFERAEILRRLDPKCYREELKLHKAYWEYSDKLIIQEKEG